MIGESFPEAVEDDLRAAVEANDGVEAVRGLRTMFVGVGRVLVTGEVTFDSALSAEEVKRNIDDIEQQLREIDDRVQIVYLEPEL